MMYKYVLTYFNEYGKTQPYPTYPKMCDLMREKEREGDNACRY